MLPEQLAVTSELLFIYKLNEKYRLFTIRTSKQFGFQVVNFGLINELTFFSIFCLRKNRFTEIRDRKCKNKTFASTAWRFPLRDKTLYTYNNVRSVIYWAWEVIHQWSPLYLNFFTTKPPLGQSNQIDLRDSYFLDILELVMVGCWYCKGGMKYWNNGL